jgi:hypothetical protein
LLLDVKNHKRFCRPAPACLNCDYNVIANFSDSATFQDFSSIFAILLRLTLYSEYIPKALEIAYNYLYQAVWSLIRHSRHAGAGGHPDKSHPQMFKSKKYSRLDK